MALLGGGLGLGIAWALISRGSFNNAFLPLFILRGRDVIIGASVSCIYGLGSPEEYKEKVVFLEAGQEHDRDLMLRKLIDIQYVRNDTLLGRGKFRVKGDIVEVQPAYSETACRISFFGDEVEAITTAGSPSRVLIMAARIRK
jgi:excinuclease UvrABC helicase subunit UvrB